MGKTSLFIALIFCTASSARAQAAATSPRALTEQVVATYIAINDAKAGKDKPQGPAAFAALDRYFDYDALSAAPFRSHRKNLKPKQVAELQKTFRVLIAELTHKSGEKLRKGEVTVSAARKVADTCAVDFAVSRPEDDIESQVTFVWRQGPHGWRVVDVAFDGASVTKDYENQFGRILQKDGASALQKKLSERLAQVTSRAP